MSASINTRASTPSSIKPKKASASRHCKEADIKTPHAYTFWYFYSDYIAMWCGKISCMSRTEYMRGLQIWHTWAAESEIKRSFAMRSAEAKWRKGGGVRMTCLNRSSDFMTDCSGADKIAGVCMLGAFLLDVVPRVFYTSLYSPKVCEPWGSC